MGETLPALSLNCTYTVFCHFADDNVQELDVAYPTHGSQVILSLLKRIESTPLPVSVAERVRFMTALVVVAPSSIVMVPVGFVVSRVVEALAGSETLPHTSLNHTLTVRSPSAPGARVHGFAGMERGVTGVATKVQAVHVPVLLMQ